MKRYITKQPHYASCGPTAIINAMKWLGKDITYRGTIDEFKELGWDIKEGIGCYDLRRSLNHFNVKYKLHKQTTVRQMEQMLNRGSSIILAYDWMSYSSEGGHYCFISDQLGNFFGAHNYLNLNPGEKEDGFFNKDLMRAYLRYTKERRKKDKTSNKWMPCVWEIINE